MEDEERQRRDEIHATLLSMDMDPELSDEAALKIGVGSSEIAIMFCIDASTRERVRKEAQKVERKTGLRSQGAKAASLRGIGASPPAVLLGNAAMGPKSSMALVLAGRPDTTGCFLEPDSDAEVTAEEEISARLKEARNSKQLRPSQAVPAVGKRGTVEDEERRLDGAPTMHTLHTSSCARHTRATHTPRTRHSYATHASCTRTMHTLQKASFTHMPSSSRSTMTRPAQCGHGPGAAWMQRATRQRSQSSERRVRTGLLAAAARGRAPSAVRVRLRLLLRLPVPRTLTPPPPPPRQRLREVTVIVAAAAAAASTNWRAS